MSGIVEELAPHGQHSLKIGDRVVVANSAPCGICFFCERSQENLCEDLMFLNGAYAESIRVPARIAFKNTLRIPDQLGFADAALTEPLACVVQGFQDCQLQSGEKVLILGSGPIGLMFAALAKQAGCHVSLLGRGTERLALATKLGVDKIFESASFPGKNPGERGYDLVFEAVGKPETWEQSISLIRKGGRVNLFGGCPSGTTVNLDTGLIHYSNLTLLASFHHTPRSVRKALEAIESGLIRASDFVGGESSLSDLPELLKSMSSGNKAVKTLIKVR